MLAWARWRGPRPAELPGDLRAMPGPCWVTAARFESSPVGPYLELAVSEPARLGVRPGMCVTTMVVSSADSRVGGRLNWGFPKELGSLVWEFEGDDRELRWIERGISVRGRPGSAVLPLLLPLRNLQRRADEARGEAAWKRRFRLKEVAAEAGAEYLTRETNRAAKAGNLNAPRVAGVGLETGCRPRPAPARLRRHPPGPAASARACTIVWAAATAIGAISSAVERCLHTAEVGGSKPSSPTSKRRNGAVVAESEGRKGAQRQSQRLSDMSGAVQRRGRCYRRDMAVT